jgi:hypothetical protein
VLPDFIKIILNDCLISSSIFLLVLLLPKVANARMGKAFLFN